MVHTLISAIPIGSYKKNWLNIEAYSLNNQIVYVASQGVSYYNGNLKSKNYFTKQEMLDAVVESSTAIKHTMQSEIKNWMNKLERDNKINNLLN